MHFPHPTLICQPNKGTIPLFRPLSTQTSRALANLGTPEEGPSNQEVLMHQRDSVFSLYCKGNLLVEMYLSHTLSQGHQLTLPGL